MTLGEHPGQGRSAVPDLAGSLPQVRVRHRQVPRHRPPGRGQPLQPGRRGDHGGFRQRRPARPRRHQLRPHRAAWLSTATRGTAPSRTAPRRPADRPTRRPVLRPDRLQQRRPHGHLHPSRGLAPRPIRPSLLRNNGDGTFTDVTKEAGLLDPVNSNSASLGRLRQRRLARPVRRLRAAAQPPVSQPGRRHVRGSRRAGRRAEPGRDTPLLQGDRPGSTSTTTTIPTCSSTTWTGTPSCITTIATAPSPTSLGDGHRRPRTASPAGPGTTTTTAGSTSSPPATTARSPTWSRACWASRTP